MNRQLEAYWRRLAVKDYLATNKVEGKRFNEDELHGYIIGYVARREKEYNDLKAEQECRRVRDLAGRVC